MWYLFLQFTTHSKTMLVWSLWMETIGMMLEIMVYRFVSILRCNLHVISVYLFQLCEPLWISYIIHCFHACYVGHLEGLLTSKNTASSICRGFHGSIWPTQMQLENLNHYVYHVCVW